MITMSIVLFIFANVFRWAELADNTTVKTFKDYINYNKKIVIAFSFCWFLITLAVWVFINFNKI